MRWLLDGRRLVLARAVILLSPIQQRIVEELMLRPGTNVDSEILLDAIYQGVPESMWPQDVKLLLRVEIFEIRKKLIEEDLDGMAVLRNTRPRKYKLVVPK